RRGVSFRKLTGLCGAETYIHDEPRHWWTVCLEPAGHEGPHVGNISWEEPEEAQAGRSKESKEVYVVFEVPHRGHHMTGPVFSSEEQAKDWLVKHPTDKYGKSYDYHRFVIDEIPKGLE
ncbi:MAG: hypothetical protein ACE5F5_13035, partial [Acidimicrobiia bacterium]